MAILLSLFIQFDFALVLSHYIVSHYITLLYPVLFVTITLTFFLYSFAGRWLNYNWGKIAKFTEMKNRIDYFIHKMIHHYVWYCWITTTKTVTSILFPTALFPGENYCLTSQLYWSSQVIQSILLKKPLLE